MSESVLRKIYIDDGVDFAVNLVLFWHGICEKVRTGKMLIWDSPNMEVTNVPEAKQLLSRTYRKDWEL